MPGFGISGPVIEGVAGVCAVTAVCISSYQVRPARRSCSRLCSGLERGLAALSRPPGSPPCCCATATQIYKHLKYYTEPVFQRYIIRIVVMVPIYAMLSFLSLVFRKASIYFDTIRDWCAPTRLARPRPAATQGRCLPPLADLPPKRTPPSSHLS